MQTEVFCQILGGSFYLLNKIFLSLGERNGKKVLVGLNFKAWSWISFLIGLPFWLILFFLEKNYIALGLESSAIPSLVLGLIISIKGSKIKEPFWIKYFVISSVVLGLYFSIIHYDGINNSTQVSEIIMVSTFLIGTYYLAKGKNIGYIYYIFMHLSCIYLMYLNNFYFLLIQQVISIGFVLDAYTNSKEYKIKKIKQLSWYDKHCKLSELENRLKLFFKEKNIFLGLFETTIWFDEPCMGEEGPNPGSGLFYILEQVKNKETEKVKSISINLFLKEDGYIKECQEILILKIQEKDFEIVKKDCILIIRTNTLTIKLIFENKNSSKGFILIKK